MHRVPERLGRVELLHADRRAVAERVDGVVVCQLASPRTARQKPTSTASGCAAIVSWTSWAPVRSATAPCSRAIAETARASAMCRSSSRNTPRVNRTLRLPSATATGFPSPRARATARPPRPAAPLRRATGRETRRSLRRAEPPSRQRRPQRGTRASPAHSRLPPLHRSILLGSHSNRPRTSQSGQRPGHQRDEAESGDQAGHRTVRRRRSERRSRPWRPASARRRRARCTAPIRPR